MKRTRSATLVSYGESSSENEPETRAPSKEIPVPTPTPTPASPPPPIKKKRKLPALASHLAPAVPPDDPSKHQGRTRTVPHVDGQWAAYIYIPLALRGALRHVVARAVDVARGEARGVRTLGGADLDPNPDADLDAADSVADVRELHVSLTRPFFLRAHQREEMKRAVRDVAKAHPPFAVSFAAFSDLTNDERTRTFLCMEVGAGHQELRALSDALTPALHSFRQKEYYAEPRFHASFAWVLLDCPSQDSLSQAPEPLELEPPSAATLLGDPDPAAKNVDSLTLPTIPRLPESIVPALNAQLSSQLKSSDGIFTVGEVRIRIGKDVFCWALTG
ncbi:hypothetical protein BC826DRAFT_906356 [Russula brevipes]|nr:hypothetical protein BC826DRAFT_906356 [Russula brevipes]